MKKVFFLFAMILCFSFLNGCDKGPESLPKFKEGQIVKFKAFPVYGMVISVWISSYDKYIYTIRVNGEREYTDSKVFSDDGPIIIKPISTVKRVREYELEAVR